MRQVVLITTGGTIEKTYDEQTGELSNRRSIVRRMLEELRLEDTEVSVVELLSKDSLDMTEEDRRGIVDAVRRVLSDVLSDVLANATSGASGVVILHGTDTLCTTGDLLAREVTAPRVPVVLTGAWRPFEMKRSDALQNLTEAIFATGALPPGVYCVAHGRTLRFPGVTKDRTLGTFVSSP